MIIEHKNQIEIEPLWKFPCHGHGNTPSTCLNVVLFIDKGVGIVVNSNGSPLMYVGRVCCDWTMDTFIPCKGASTTFAD